MNIVMAAFYFFDIDNIKNSIGYGTELQENSAAQEGQASGTCDRPKPGRSMGLPCRIGHDSTSDNSAAVGGGLCRKVDRGWWGYRRR